MIRRLTFFIVTFVLAAGAFAQDESTFSVNFLASAVNLNPLVSYTTTEAQIYTGIYEGLVTYDPYTLDPLPAIARRWEVSEDGKVYRFSLRRDARYSNGDPVLASHFRDAWLMLLDPETDAPYASLLDIVSGARDYRTGETANPSDVGIRASSDRVLEVELETRATHFLRILCHHAFVTVHPEMLGRDAWSETDPLIVSGPYTIESMSAEQIELARNPNYWDARNVDIDRLRLQFSDDVDQVTSQFNRGELDWARGGSVDLGAIERQETIVVNPLFATSYFQFSAAVDPFGDPRVRRAYALLLPWEEIRSDEYQYLPSDSLVPSIPSYPEVEGIATENREAALTLLDEAGYVGGDGLPDMTITIPGGLDLSRIANLMKETWEEHLGITVTIDTVFYPGYFELVDNEQFTLSTISWIGDFADPLTFLDMWTSNSNLNNSSYSNAEYDELVRRATGELGNERYELLAEAERILLNDAIVLPINHTPSVNYIDLELVDGWYPNPLDIHPFKFLAFSAGGPLPNIASVSESW